MRRKIEPRRHEDREEFFPPEAKKDLRVLRAFAVDPAVLCLQGG
jgi:hypothetical protein